MSMSFQIYNNKDKQPIEAKLFTNKEREKKNRPKYKTYDNQTNK